MVSKLHDNLVGCGGVPTILMGNDATKFENINWNFGVTEMTPEVAQIIKDTPSLYSMFPVMQGKWDGETTINHHEACRSVLGHDLKAQKQPRGTCGGRAAKQACDMLQCIMIASGKRAEFKEVSHSWLYYAARRMYNMLRGNPNDKDNDGVAGGSMPKVLAEIGTLTQEEAGDTNDYGNGSDDLACKWGVGQIDSATVQRFNEMAKDNLVTAWAPCKSAQECADALASGGVILQSDMQGFSFQRDSEGVCNPQGQWAHYHIRSGVRKTPTGRKVFNYDQSWGDSDTDNTSPGPRGPKVPDCPGNVFSVPWDVQDHLCRTGQVAALFSFDLYDLQNGIVDLPWIF